MADRQEIERRWTVAICNGCGGIIGLARGLSVACTCEPSHAKTGRTCKFVPEATLQQVEERVRELRDALEPFAAEADWAADMLCEPERLLRPDMAITVAHLQAAKAAIEPPIVCRDCGTTAPGDRTGWTFEMGGPWRCPTCSAAFETKEEPR